MRKYRLHLRRYRAHLKKGPKHLVVITHCVIYMYGKLLPILQVHR